ncbi:MAG: HNH endonuclease [Chloroflexota bacterium]|nr:HNH endonuclease [Chloroflexota bacterium]
MKRQDNTCGYCGYRRIARTLDIDHMIPAVRGGSNDESNLQVICRPCNQRKGLQTDQEFRARYSRLVPAAPLTPPKRRISQSEFKEETRRTSQAASAREFRKRRYITPREKIVSGCFISGGAVFGIALFGLAAIGAEGLLLLFPALILSVAIGLGIWLRAYMTGATSEVEG